VADVDWSDPESVTDALEAYAGDLEEAVAALVAFATGAALTYLLGLLGGIRVAWDAAPDEDSARRRVGGALAGTPPARPVPPARLAAIAGLGAAAVAGLAGVRVPSDASPSTLALTTAATALREYRARTARPAWQADPPRTAAEAEDAVATQLTSLRRAALGVDMAARTAAADGEAAAGRTARLHRVWVTERDGCVVCLSLAGQVVAPGEAFDAAATFGPYDPPPVWGDALDAPPRHPHCRCRLGWGTPTQLVGSGYAAGLEREARRSIVRGWSLESESPAVRLRAAERLLAQGAGLPKSVEAYGRKAVREGAWPRGRAFPGASPAPQLLRPTPGGTP
jgi:hypothetical protein